MSKEKLKIETEEQQNLYAGSNTIPQSYVDQDDEINLRELASAELVGKEEENKATSFDHNPYGDGEACSRKINRSVG